MRITLLGKHWRIERPRRLTHDGEEQHGDCDPPDRPSKAIRVVNYVRGRDELETYLHEMLHACDWSKDEEWVEQAAHDIAAVLWRVGYRRNGTKTGQTGH